MDGLAREHHERRRPRTLDVTQIQQFPCQQDTRLHRVRHHRHRFFQIINGRPRVAAVVCGLGAGEQGGGVSTCRDGGGRNITAVFTRCRCDAAERQAFARRRVVGLGLEHSFVERACLRLVAVAFLDRRELHQRGNERR